MVAFNTPSSPPILPALPLTAKFDALADRFTSSIAADVLDEDRCSSISSHVSVHLNLECPCCSPLCYQFSMHELDAALLRLRNSAPGLDGLPASFYKHLSLTARRALLQLFNTSWSQGVVPAAWRHSVVLPFPKPSGSPNNPSSYRPISLSPVACRIMEHLILARLDWFLNCTRTLSPFQSGFRRGRSTIHNHILLEHDIRSAFAGHKSVLACFLDLQGAFDTVWHAGLLYKLHQLNLPLCFLKWTHSLLTNRTFRIRIGGHHSVAYHLTAGTPQGCVLSPILFALMINDLPDCLPPEVSISMYADDIAIWTSGRDFAVMGCHLQDTLDAFDDWASDWGFRFSPSKSVVVPFTNRRSFQLEFSLLLYDTRIPTSTQHRFLGIIFDQKLSWTPHLHTIQSAVHKRINIMRRIAGHTWGADRDSLLLLFKTLIQPLLDYGAPLFVSASRSFHHTLAKLQAACLRVCLGLPHTTPHLALQVEAGVPPPLMRLKILSARFLSRTLLHSLDSPIVQLLQQWPSTQQTHWTRTPPSAYTLTRLLPDVDVLQLAQAGPSFHRDLSIPTWLFPPPTVVVPQLPNKDSVAPDVLRALFLDATSPHFDHHTAIFTDGSFSPDSGYTAASFFIPTGGVSSSARLPDHSGIFHAELAAILLALNHVLQHAISPAVVYSDSLSSLSAIVSASSARPTNHWRLLRRIQRELYICSQHSICIVLHWVPSHVGISGNEEADRLAASATTDYPIELPPSLDSHQRSYNQMLTTEWQTEWDSSTKCRALHTVKRPVLRWPHLSYGPRPMSSALARLRTGHTFLHEPAHRRGLHDTPNCRFCGLPETVQHFLADCTILRPLRESHLNAPLRAITISNPDVTYLLRGGNPPFIHHATIFRALWSFIQATGVTP